MGMGTTKQDYEEHTKKKYIYFEVISSQCPINSKKKTWVKQHLFKVSFAVLGGRD